MRKAAYLFCLLSPVFCLVLVSCDNQQIEVYRIPKEKVALENGSPGLVPPAPEAKPVWTKPDGWETEPLSEMRLGSFKVNGPNGRSADISVTAFPGDAGGLASNVNRWRGQVQQPPLPEADLEKSIQKSDADGVECYFVDLQTPENAATLSRILGAVIPQSDRTWFVKMTGDPTLLEEQRSKFQDFVRSFRFAKPAGELATPPKTKSTNDKQ
jgi:hypothetical protein